MHTHAEMGITDTMHAWHTTTDAMHAHAAQATTAEQLPAHQTRAVTSAQQIMSDEGE